MNDSCPHCATPAVDASGIRRIVSAGSFFRSSDQRQVARFLCHGCQRTFSEATRDPCYDQRKRQLNPSMFELLCSCVSQRRAARLLRCNRKTVVRKLIFLSGQAAAALLEFNRSKPLAKEVQFDDLEMFEHTKLKPLSVPLAVEAGTRRILGFAVAQMPANGPLAKLSRKKYGPRKDLRGEGRRKLFTSLIPLVEPTANFRSDQNPHYPRDLKKILPDVTHETARAREER